MDRKKVVNTKTQEGHPLSIAIDEISAIEWHYAGSIVTIKHKNGYKDFLILEGPETFKKHVAKVKATY